MKKIIFLFFLIILISHAIGSESCDQFNHESLKMLRVTKTYNQLNELHFNLKINPDCTFQNTETPMVVFWSLAKRRGAPCEAPLLKEIRDIIGFNDKEDMDLRIAEYINPNEINVYMPSLNMLVNKVGSNDIIDNNLRVLIHKTNGVCELKTTAIINNAEVNITRIHSIIRLLRIKKIELFDKNNIVHILH